MRFKSVYNDSRSLNGDDYAFVFSGGDLLVHNDSVPFVKEITEFLSDSGVSPDADGIFFGSIGNANCYAYNMPDGFRNDGFDIMCGDGFGIYQFMLLRRYLTELDSEICSAAGYAAHLLHWHGHSRFCGRCGTKNHWYKNERAKKCPACGNIQFPKISPAIIIMIRKDDKILLAHNSHFPEGRYSLLAGFTEMGETIEETAAREVREECGIEIENIRYLSSQSWPFPDSLMLGFTADYKSGDIVPDGKEIVHADWYSPDNFPSIPEHGTIARKIIDIYTKENKSGRPSRI